MLYSLYEAQHAWLTPFRLIAEAQRGWLTNPFMPWVEAPLAKKLAATNDLFLRVTARYEKPEWRIAGADIKVALDLPFCKLLHFVPAVARTRPAPKILVVAPLSGHHATLLRDTVRTLLAEHDVWVTEWVDARTVPLTAGPFHLIDYVAYVREFIRLLSPELHVMSVCQPTVPVLCTIALMAESREPHPPKTMIMMGGPIDARKSPTAVNNLAMTRPLSWFERHVIHRVPAKYPGYHRRVYPGFLQHLDAVARREVEVGVVHGDPRGVTPGGSRRVHRGAEQ